MTAFPAHVALDLARSWTPILAGLSDPALLLDADELVLGHTRAARSLLGASVDVPGMAVRAILGLEVNAPIEGEALLRPPASGLEVGARLQRTPLWDSTGHLAGSLLLIFAGPVTELDGGDESTEGRLREVALTISSALDIDLVLDQVVRLAIELLGASAGSLPLYDVHFDRLLPSHVVGIAAAVITGPVYRGSGAIWHLIDTGQSFLRNDYANDPRALKGLLDAGVRAVAAAPVRAGDQLLGVINLYQTEAGRGFTRRDLDLLEMIGRHAGVALQNARRYQELRRDADRRYLLYQASLAFGAALVPEELYRAIHHNVLRLMPCDTIAIALLDEPAQVMDYVYLSDGCGRWPGGRISVTRGLLGVVIRSGLSLRVTGCDPEIEAMFGAEPFGEGEDPTGSLVAAPLQVGEQIIGAITVQSISFDGYSPDDLDILETLAAMAAIALQNAQLFAQVHDLATTDPLTGVVNRRHFFECARLEVDRSARYGHPVSMLMLDADHFKGINDQYGHLAGDEVLRVIAARCQANLREVDLVGRYGGEEFLVLLPETDAAQALIVADRLREAVGGEPVLTGAGAVAVRVSIGVSSIPAGATGSVEGLIDLVDQALYQAKAGGRDRACVS